MEFFLRLDYKLIAWEERLTLFTGHMIENGLQSATIKSYLLAVRGILAMEGISIEQNSFVLTSLIRTSKIINDQLRVRLPIHKDLLKLILNKLKAQAFEMGQIYQNGLFAALFAAAYYGLFRIGEITKGDPVILAVNVHVGINKKKLLFILNTSKTHNKGDRPQKVKISAAPVNGNKKITKGETCPFNLDLISE